MVPFSGNEQSPGRFEDEITISEIIDSFAAALNWIKRHFLYLVICIIIGSAIAFMWSFRKSPSYVAELTFMLNDENNPQISSIGGILGQLGLPVPTGKYNVDKLLEISKSRRLVESALLTNKIIEGQSGLLINHFIDIFEVDKKWKYNKESLSGFRFLKVDRESFSDKENFVIKAVVDAIVGIKQNRSNALFSTDYGRTDYIMSFIMSSPSEDLSITFVNEIFDQVASFYIAKAREKNKSVFDIIQEKHDSVTTLIRQKAYDLANLEDKNSGSFRNTNNVRIALLESELIGLQSGMQEITKNLERAQFGVETSTPLIQVLDRPISPLIPQKPSLFKWLLAGALAGIIAYFLIIFLSEIIHRSQSNSLL